jgi:hypothetical protein
MFNPENEQKTMERCALRCEQCVFHGLGEVSAGNHLRLGRHMLGGDYFDRFRTVIFQSDGKYHSDAIQHLLVRR